MGGRRGIGWRLEEMQGQKQVILIVKKLDKVRG